MPRIRPLEVLVTGATGKQGGAVARALLGRGHTVRALTRKPDSAGAEALRQQGAIVVVGDFDDPASLERAVAGTDTVFAVSIPWGEGGLEAETRQGIALVDAAGKAGTKHFVFTSTGALIRRPGSRSLRARCRSRSTSPAQAFPTPSLRRSSSWKTSPAPPCLPR